MILCAGLVGQDHDGVEHGVKWQDGNRCSSCQLVRYQNGANIKAVVGLQKQAA